MFLSERTLFRIFFKDFSFFGISTDWHLTRSLQGKAQLLKQILALSHFKLDTIMQLQMVR